MLDLHLRSQAFNDHDAIPTRLSREGENNSPSLSWSGVPEETTELVLLCSDPDAGKTPFLHWLVTGIDPNTSGVDEGQLPAHGHEWTNDYGTPGYGGPQPPMGDDPHRYFFRLYALKQPANLAPGQSAADIHKSLERQAVATGTLVGTYAR